MNVSDMANVLRLISTPVPPEVQQEVLDAYERDMQKLEAELATLRADLEAATQTITAQAEVLRHTRDALTAALHKWADEQDTA